MASLDTNTEYEYRLFERKMDEYMYKKETLEISRRLTKIFYQNFQDVSIMGTSSEIAKFIFKKYCDEMKDAFSEALINSKEDVNASSQAKEFLDNHPERFFDKMKLSHSLRPREVLKKIIQRKFKDKLGCSQPLDLHTIG